jgi:hypothetical protein
MGAAVRIGGRHAAAHTAGMAVSGTVPPARPARIDLLAQANRMRRANTLLTAIVAVWLLAQFATLTVPAGMATVPEAPPGAWLLVDRWCVGARVGCNVFVDTPDGRMLSRITAMDADTVRIEHPAPGSGLRDSRDFGPLPRSALASTVLVVFAAHADRSFDGR